MKLQRKVVAAWTAIGIGIGVAIGAANGAMAVCLAAGAALGIAIGLQIQWRGSSASLHSSVAGGESSAIVA